MDIDAYVQHINNVIFCLDNTFPNIENDPSEWELRSIRKQLEFILHYAKSGESFKQGLLKRKRETVSFWLESCPTKDTDLLSAIKTIYADLDIHDYNVGAIDRSVSEKCFDTIGEKYLHYDNLKEEKSLREENVFLSFKLASYFSDYLISANYIECWLANGIKNTQYFFLVNLFSYLGLTVRAIDERLPSGEGTLSDDIERIHNFYTSLESEGTHMWLNPVELKEDGDQAYLVDLRGNIIEKGDNAIEI